MGRGKGALAGLFVARDAVLNFKFKELRYESADISKIRTIR
jgi:hypothetical protein